METLGNDGLPKMLAGFEDKSATAMTIYAYLEAEDAEPVLFVGETEGSIVKPRGIAKFGWDSNFEEKTTKLTYFQTEAAMQRCRENSSTPCPREAKPDENS